MTNDLTAYRRLARAVLNRAMEDAESAATPPPPLQPSERSTEAYRRRVDEWQQRFDASWFLSRDNQMLRHWCDLADMTPEAFIPKYQAHWLSVREIARAFKRGEAA